MQQLQKEWDFVYLHFILMRAKLDVIVNNQCATEFMFQTNSCKNMESGLVWDLERNEFVQFQASRKIIVNNYHAWSSFA